MPFRLTLIVDDDPDMRFYLRTCLQGLGIQRVLEAADGEEALALARSGVDLVISDVVIPRLDGYALCRAIKGDAASRGVPVLLISGEEGASAGEVGADGFLAKPFNARQLREAVERLPRDRRKTPPSGGTP